jgi:hypothetical protein
LTMRFAGGDSWCVALDVTRESGESYRIERGSGC